MRLLLGIILALVLAPPAQAATVSLQFDRGQVDAETDEETVLPSAAVSVLDRAGEVNDLTTLRAAAPCGRL